MWLGRVLVYRDEICVAFLDLNPLNDGHVLVVPKVAIERLTDLESEIAAQLFRVAQKILSAIKMADSNCEGANIFLSDGKIAGQDVPHVHLHVVPRNARDGIRISFGKSVQRAEREQLNQIAKNIASKIQGMD